MRSAMRSRSAAASGLAERQLDAEGVGNLRGRRLDPREAALRVLDHQAAADRDGGGGDDPALLDQGELGGAAADIDIEQGHAVAARERHRAGAVGRELALHVVPGRGADELAGLLREQVGDGARVAALDRLAGEDDRAAVDLVAFDARIGVAAADEAGELVDVDGVVGQIGGEQDRRFPQDLAADHHEPARQRVAQPLQVHAREHQMRGRRADVDADRGQLDIVGRPGHLVERLIGGADVEMLEFEIVHSDGRAGRLQAASLTNFAMPDFTPYLASSDR